MKNNISMRLLTLALLSLVQLPALADIHDRIEYKLNRVLRDVEIINNEIAAECTVIRPEDFEDADGNLTQTYVIAAPGKYCLGGNVDFVPEDEFTPAIAILSDDVSLSLNGFTLNQANDTPNCYGVQIGQGYFYDDPDAVLKNITVLNGNITDFTAIGVFCYNGSFDGPTAELAFQDLRFFDLNILDCGTTDLTTDLGASINLDSLASINKLFLPETKVAYKDIRIEHCNLNRCKNGSGSVNVSTYENLIISDTQCNDSLTLNNFSGIAAYSVPGRNLQMFRCQGNGTTDLDPLSTFFGVECIGIWPGRAINVYLEDCQFNETFGEASVIVNGASLTGVYNFVAQNCQFNNSRGGAGVGGWVVGVHSSDRKLQQFETDSHKYINCQFNGASVSDNNPGRAGLSLIGGLSSVSLRNIIFENCQACNIITTNTGFSSYGFLVRTSPQDPGVPFGNTDNISFTGCTASDIKGGRNAVGISTFIRNENRTGAQASQTNIVVENCIVERIRSNTSIDQVAGIAVLLLQDSIGTQFPRAQNLFIRGCRVSDVRSNIDDPSPLSAGILVESVINPVLQNNSVSDCDRGILFTGTNEIIPNGFQLAATLEDALAFPPVFIDLNTIPSAAPAQDFFNSTQGNSVSIAPSAATIDTTHDFIFPSDDLTALGWQPGDEIFYDCNGGDPISDLVCSTTYYAIVYIPGFSENGVVQQNEVDNCSISGYQDDLLPNTTSAWVDNAAFNNGSPVPSDTTNYAINWAGVDPVDIGTLAAYPTPGNKYYNLSLIP